MKKKSIILVVPFHFELYKELILSLQREGLEIIFLFVTDQPFNYRNLLQRVHSFLQKNLFSNKDFKKQLVFARENHRLISQLEQIDTDVDYALIIRADLLGLDTLSIIKNRVSKFVAYQWDGLDRFPAIFDRISYFDKFFVFDKGDYETYTAKYLNLHYTTNFYFEIPKIENIVVKPKSVCFVGSYLEGRMNRIQQLTEFLQGEGIDIDVKLLCSSTSTIDKYKDSGIDFITKPFTYNQMVEHVQKYEVLLDFDNSLIHRGLSFRFFEALFYKKKVITNNSLVKSFDFYHPNNVFIWNSNNLLSLKEFLEVPMVKIDQSIVEKYSFGNWIRRVLD
ncbi:MULTISPECIES: hypothetical protein [Sphingobacterium]|uniref:hypothetical protein n=1 Tax=Sphingobacterium TaxID=28453 RepID=UPI0013DCE771|nr:MULTISPECIES: hypothetical protein [unclassified Sphingobacterium]